jgi:deoxyribonuclease-4
VFLGIHCSVRAGYLPALSEAGALGVTAMQMLPYRRHHEPSLEEFSAFRRARAGSSVARLLIHSRYLPALAASDLRRRNGSVFHLVREIGYARALAADAFVLHIGAFSPGSSFEEGLLLFCRSLSEARERTGGFPLLLENVAGGGRRMGGGVRELARILEAAQGAWPECGVCLDTAHAWASGTEADLGDAAAFLTGVRSRLGDALKAWHISDSLAEPGSHRESHWHLGEGRLGAALGGLLRRLAVMETMVILETPKGEDEDRSNLAWARAAASGTK